jgi:hypothetical protein
MRAPRSPNLPTFYRVSTDAIGRRTGSAEPIQIGSHAFVERLRRLGRDRKRIQDYYPA